MYWVAEWPRTETGVGFWQPLLGQNGAWRTVTLIAEPVPARVALRQIRRSQVSRAADAAHRTRTGRLDAEADRVEVDDLTRREADLIAGHGDLRFGALIVVSAPDRAALDSASALMETAAAQSMCDVRRLVGQQATAHTAAALPLAASVLK